TSPTRAGRGSAPRACIPSTPDTGRYGISDPTTSNLHDLCKGKSIVGMGNWLPVDRPDANASRRVIALKRPLTCLLWWFLVLVLGYVGVPLLYFVLTHLFPDVSWLRFFSLAVAVLFVVVMFVWLVVIVVWFIRLLIGRRS